MGFISTNCPGCGSPIELDESREFGFCQFCGTKIVQDKIIVQHQGSVKVDNSDLIVKYQQNAQRALDKHDWEEVEKYYNLIEQNTSNNMEAVFFSSYGKAMLSLTDNDYYKRQQKFDVLNRSMSVISDYYDVTDEDKEKVLRKIKDYIDKMFEIQFVYQSQEFSLVGAINLLANTVGSKPWCVNLLNTTKNAFLIELQQIYAKHQDDFVDELIKEITGPVQENNTSINNQETTKEVKESVKSSELTANTITNQPKPPKWNSFSAMWNNETSRIGLIGEATGFLILFLGKGTAFSVIISLLLIFCSCFLIIKYVKESKVKAKEDSFATDDTGPIDHSKSKKVLIVCVLLLIISIVAGFASGGSSDKYVETAYAVYTNPSTKPYFAEDYRLKLIDGKIIDKDSAGRKLVVLKVEEEAPWGGETLMYELALVMYKDSDGDICYYSIYTCGPGGLESDQIADLKNEVNWGNSIT